MSTTATGASPSLAGQRALAELPGRSSIMLSRTVGNYTVPDRLVMAGGGGSTTTASAAAAAPWSSSASAANDSFVGISVLKVNKAGKLQPRRLAITADRRNVVISSHKITSLRGLLSRLSLKKRRGADGSGAGGGGGAAGGPGAASAGDAAAAASASSSATKVISLEAIDRIQRGASTHKFVLARHEAQASGAGSGAGSAGGGGGGNTDGANTGSNSSNVNVNSSVLLKLLSETPAASSTSTSQSCCFSIVYHCSSSSGGGADAGGAPTSMETLDLVVPDLTEYETLVTCLEDLHHLHCQERLRTSAHLQRLQAQWVALGKAFREPLKEADFLALCDRLQVPLKRAVLSIMFREELATTSTTTAMTAASNSSQSSTVVAGGRVKARITVSSSSTGGGSQAPKAGSGSQQPPDDRLGFAGVACLLETIAKTSTATQPIDHPAFERLWQELLDTDPVPPVRLHSYPAAQARRATGPPGSGGHGVGQDEGGAGADADADADASGASLELRIPVEESISALAFLGFLRSTQKEFSTSLEQATHIVQALNAQITADDLALQEASGYGYDGGGGGAAPTARGSSALPRVGTTASTVALHAPSQQDRLTKSQLMEYLTCDSNDLLQPSMGRSGHDDMTKPLSHYWIHTSHDTFLEPLSHSFVKSQYQQFAHPTAGATSGGGAASANPSAAGGSPLRHSSSHHHSREWSVQEQPYMAALLRGVRCVEIDVWDGLDGKEPVVARSQPTSASDRRISLSIILRTVAAFLDLYPHSYPVLIRLENHATSPVVLQRIAQLFTEILGGRIAKPSLDLQSLDSPSSAPLPSPESLRGKVVLIGKRPKRLVQGLKVCRDDYDADNDSFHMLEKIREVTTAAARDGLDDYYFDNDSSVVVGFTAQGPVRANRDAPGVAALSPNQLLEATVMEYRRVQGAVEQLSDRVRERELAADEAESKAAHFTHLSGWTTDQVKERAVRLQQGGTAAQSTRDIEEEKSTKDEGMEVHEVLPELVEGSRGRYEQAAREAMEGAGHEAQCHALLKEKEVALQMARENLSMARERESAVSENAKKARSEAIANQEHAEVARERVLKVRDLLKNCKDQTSTAGTVVQTALTEAKISEKRATDAEARAARAQQAADADRKRAEDETRKEEMLEQQVNDLHDDCMKATEATRDARERLEKAAAMLERVNDQLKVIETSSQYRTEVQARSSSEYSAVPRGGSVLAKHAAKLDEREMCRELIREASEEAASADANRKELQRAFEDRAYQWRVQADLAAAARRTADRSLHIADELLEQAEEEREAANLRHTARQRAEATVENKGSHRSSLEAQLVEAERAAAEAANVALQSKKRAEHLAREADKLKDHSRFQKVLEDLEWERDMAKQEYDAARADRERKDRAMADEKRRLDTNAAVCKEATREAAVETDRTREAQYYQQEAVVAYGEALACRQEASATLDQLTKLQLKADGHRLAVERAKEYKSRMDMMIELPLDLSRLTMFNSAKYLNWSRSMSLSKAEMHSFAHNVLLLMVDKSPDEERRNLHSFSKNHLCRVYPSWKALQNKNFTNYDPVFAWSLGCQMVSSNLHSADESLLVADGRFRQNGSCGYVLKPPYLLDNISKTEGAQRWSVQVMSGHNLPRPASRKASGPASPLVKISVYSGSHKETRISYRTRPARRAGLHPVWTTNNKFELAIPIPSVSMVAFSVWHVSEDGAEAFMGASALPASCLREGFRSVALFDERHSRSGEYRNACLLVKTTRK